MDKTDKVYSLLGSEAFFCFFFCRVGEKAINIPSTEPSCNITKHTDGLSESPVARCLDPRRASLPGEEFALRVAVSNFCLLYGSFGSL